MKASRAGIPDPYKCNLRQIAVRGSEHPDDFPSDWKFVSYYESGGILSHFANDPNGSINLEEFVNKHQNYESGRITFTYIYAANQQ